MIFSERVKLRHPTNLDDQLFFESHIDWEDGNGVMTKSRAAQLLERALNHIRCAHYPLDRASVFFDYFVIEVEGTPVGYTKIYVTKNKVIEFQHLSISPEHRGKGLFYEIYLLLTALTFEVYRAERLWHEDFVDVKALEIMRERHGGVIEREWRNKNANRQMLHRDTVRFTFTDRHYEKVISDFYVNKDGTPLTWKIDYDAIDARNARVMDPQTAKFYSTNFER